jgi:hypothetical protein
MKSKEAVMFEILSQSRTNCIGVKVSGKALAGDYPPLLARLDEGIAAYGEINLIVVVEGFHGWDDLDAAKADYHFGTDQYRHVRRCAFVSDRNSHKWVVKLLDPFTRRTDEKFFVPDEQDKAWEWACPAE